MALYRAHVERTGPPLAGEDVLVLTVDIARAAQNGGPNEAHQLLVDFIPYGNSRWTADDANRVTWRLSRETAAVLLDDLRARYPGLRYQFIGERRIGRAAIRLQKTMKQFLDGKMPGQIKHDWWGKPVAGLGVLGIAPEDESRYSRALREGTFEHLDEKLSIREAANETWGLRGYHASDVVVWLTWEEIAAVLAAWAPADVRRWQGSDDVNWVNDWIWAHPSIGALRRDLRRAVVSLRQQVDYEVDHEGSWGWVYWVVERVRGHVPGAGLSGLHGRDAGERVFDGQNSHKEHLLSEARETTPLRRLWDQLHHEYDIGQSFPDGLVELLTWEEMAAIFVTHPDLRGESGALQRWVARHETAGQLQHALKRAVTWLRANVSYDSILSWVELRAVLRSAWGGSDEIGSLFGDLVAFQPTFKSLALNVCFQWADLSTHQDNPVFRKTGPNLCELFLRPSQKFVVPMREVKRPVILVPCPTPKSYKHWYDGAWHDAPRGEP